MVLLQVLTFCETIRVKWLLRKSITTIETLMDQLNLPCTIDNEKLNIMKNSKYSYSKRTKIIVICMLLFLILYIGRLFTDIIDENPLYEGGFWITILAWMTSMYFDGKAK